MKQGDSLGVNGTPTLFINGERISGALPQAELWIAIDRALREAGVQPPPQVAEAEKKPVTSHSAAPQIETMGLPGERPLEPFLSRPGAHRHCLRLDKLVLLVVCSGANKATGRMSWQR